MGEEDLRQVTEKRLGDLKEQAIQASETLAKNAASALADARAIAEDAGDNLGRESEEAEAKLREAIAEILDDVERVRERMRTDQVEIDRLRMETRTMLSKLLAA
jgi:polyhydroxyalkanoate synthesis regulator phasin